MITVCFAAINTFLETTDSLISNVKPLKKQENFLSARNLSYVINCVFLNGFQN